MESRQNPLPRFSSTGTCENVGRNVGDDAVGDIIGGTGIGDTGAGA